MYFSLCSVRDHVLLFLVRKRSSQPYAGSSLSAAAVLKPVFMGMQESSQSKKFRAAVSYCIVSE